jgi:hypothetical protein
MIVKPVVPGAVIRDPVTRQALPAEGGEVPDNTFWTRRWLGGEVWRREGDEWVRRLPDGTERRERIETATPTGREPVTPLTTR